MGRGTRWGGNPRDYAARTAPSAKDTVVATVRDVTRSQQARAGLRESEARLHSLVTNAPVILLAIDSEGVFTAAEGKALSLIGLSPEEHIGRSVFDMYGNLPEVCDVARRALAGESFTTTVELQTRAFEAHVTPVRDEENKITGAVAVATDVTERRRAEEARRESEERLHAILMNAPIMMGAIDGEGVFTAVEGAAAGLLPLSPEEHIGRSVFDLYSHMPGVCDAVRRVLAGEVFSRTAELGPFTVDVNLTPIRDAEGTVTGAVAIATNVTERARAERALRESEERFRRLAENSIDGILLAEADEVRFVNAALVKMLGYEREEEIVGRPFTDFVSPAHREMMLARGQARREGREVPFRYEFRALRKNGSEFDVEIAVSTITYQGRQARQGVLRDVTERKRAEEALRESEERFRRLSEAALEGIVIHDGGRVLEANQQVATMLGCELSDVIGAELSRFVTAESYDLMRQHILSGSEEPYEAVALKIDGTPFPVELRAKNAFYQGRKVRLGAVRDLTEHKRAEETLQREREELEAKAERRIGRAKQYKLTFRELTVLYLVAAGMADKEIAFRLGISHRTVSKHIENILAKMRATSRTEAGVRAIREGLVEGLK